MAYIKKDNYPSLKKPGVYSSGSIKELGLNNDDLEKFSLGNWNSTVKDNKIFKGVTDTLFLERAATEGKLVQVGFEEPDELELIVVSFQRDVVPDGISGNGVAGAIRPETVDPDWWSGYYSNSGMTHTGIFEWDGSEDHSEWDANTPPPPGIFPNQDFYRRAKFFDIYSHYYDFIGLPPWLFIEDENYAQKTFKEDKLIDINTTPAFIKARESNDVSSSLEFEPVDPQPFLNLVKERPPIDTVYYPDPANVDLANNNYLQYRTNCQIFFPSKLQFRDSSADYSFDLPISNVPPFSEGEFFEMDISDEIAAVYFGGVFSHLSVTPNLTSIGGPEFDPDEYGNVIVSHDDIQLDDTVSNVTGSAMNVDEVKFIVRARTEEQNEFLYHDRLTSLKYTDTSYPVEVTFNLSIFDYPDFVNQLGTTSGLDDRGDFFLSMSSTNLHQRSYFTYQVIQWGDEKVLLTDDQIEQTYFFSLYDLDEYPEPNSYIFKKWVASQQSETTEIQTETSHVYNTPGVKPIKIVVYRYGRDKSVLGQTYLVTRNIIINDGILLSQDFSIFGGTDFNFLPLSNKEAIIGGLDEDSKYNNSVEKIKKDDNFIQDDYLEKASSREFIDNFNKKLYGESPGQLDLSTTRMYKKPLDIYDFITDDKQSIVDNNFNINTLPINSFATDIFISNNDCIVDLNPQDIEYLSIQNKTGTADKAILIGDYKVNQPKDGRVQKQGVMETPLLDDTQDKQAF